VSNTLPALQELHSAVENGERKPSSLPSSSAHIADVGGNPWEPCVDGVLDEPCPICLYAGKVEPADDEDDRNGPLQTGR